MVARLARDPKGEVYTLGVYTQENTPDVAASKKDRIVICDSFYKT